MSAGRRQISVRQRGSGGSSHTQIFLQIGLLIGQIKTKPFHENLVMRVAKCAVGDFRAGYLVVDRMGVRVLRDPYSAKPYVLFYTTKRVGGGVQNFEAIKLVKFGVS